MRHVAPNGQIDRIVVRDPGRGFVDGLAVGAAAGAAGVFAAVAASDGGMGAIGAVGISVAVAVPLTVVTSVTGVVRGSRYVLRYDPLPSR